MELYTGEVIWFERGYGFIQWKKDGVDQPDMFVHFSDILMEGYKQLQAGEKVSFGIGANYDGKPKAIEVSRLD